MSAAVSIISHSPEATERLGSRLATILVPGMVVAMRGTLGTGKTVLSRGLAQGLGICEAVTSPTFTVVQEYRRGDSGWFFHLDMYRIPDTHAALAFGIDDYLFAADGITAVEWPEHIEKLLAEQPADRCSDLVSVTLAHTDNGNRLITLEPQTYAQLAASVECDPELRQAAQNDKERP